jgi:hypothetical protein
MLQLRISPQASILMMANLLEMTQVPSTLLFGINNQVGSTKQLSAGGAN